MMATEVDNAELWMSFTDTVYMHALSIPIDQCRTFAVYPLKWLCFLGYAIYGKEGYISTSEGGPEVDDYETDIQPVSYYFISGDKPSLLDPGGIDDRTSDALTISTSRAGFRRRISERDGTCVMTGSPDEYCEASHIIPHAKGDQYMSYFASHRGGEESDQDLNEINDTRNGLLLTKQVHYVVGLAQAAFLQTPNFALSVDDIYYNVQPTVSDIHFNNQSQEGPVNRLTIQHFNMNDPVVSFIAPHNSDARQPEDTDQWPPALIFDFAYGCTALGTWGMPDFLDFATERAQDVYYDRDPSGPSTRHICEQVHACDARTGTEQRASDIMDMVMGLWRRHASTRQEAHPSEVDCNQDKVKTWLESAADLDTAV